MGYYINFNGKQRTDINEVYTTIKFKSVFPDFAKWESTLLKFGIDQADIKADEFNLLQTMVGNSHLMFKTGVKNEGHTAFQFRKLLFIRKKEEKLNNLDIDTALSQISTNTQTLFTINRVKGSTQPDNDYIDNKTKSELVNKISPIDRIKELKELNNLQDPSLLFLMRLANNILLPLQPEQVQKGAL